ncbi:hypothetical protein Q1M63_20980 [Sinorhizobium meliloti]|nr:hypothetical protein Q1M63_20980 [Sinorhizobium meliloti]
MSLSVPSPHFEESPDIEGSIGVTGLVGLLEFLDRSGDVAAFERFDPLGDARAGGRCRHQ